MGGGWRVWTFLTDRKRHRTPSHSGDAAQSPGHSTHPRRGAHVWKHAREVRHEESRSRLRIAPHSAGGGDRRGERLVSRAEARHVCHDGDGNAFGQVCDRHSAPEPNAFLCRPIAS